MKTIEELELENVLLKKENIMLRERNTELRTEISELVDMGYAQMENRTNMSDIQIEHWLEKRMSIALAGKIIEDDVEDFIVGLDQLIGNYTKNNNK